MTHYTTLRYEVADHILTLTLICTLICTYTYSPSPSLICICIYTRIFISRGGGGRC